MRGHACRGKKKSEFSENSDFLGGLPPRAERTLRTYGVYVMSGHFVSVAQVPKFYFKKRISVNLRAISVICFLPLKLLILEPVEVGGVAATSQILAAQAHEGAGEHALPAVLVGEDAGIENPTDGG